ncbi:MAG: hypothetical protein R3C19_06390 [Planctomycetaceae bacterium]
MSIRVIIPRQQSRLRKRLSRRYPADKEITVYFDAAHPQTAVLERGASARPIIAILAGIPLLIFGLLLVRWLIDGAM